MAKIAEWEAEIRETVEGLASQINGGWSLALLEHETRRREDPENVPAINPQDPAWTEKLVPMARRMVDVWSAVVRAIQAEEEGDAAEYERAMRKLSAFIDGMNVKLNWSRGPRGYHLATQHSDDPERYPFAATAWALGFMEYVTVYSPIVHLGVCRQCMTVYLKPKHGQKMRYCSHACAQKAYRKRKKKAEGS